MQHYGEKQVTFKYDGGESKDPIGLMFQVTDVRKPLLAVRMLVEKGNKVVLAGDDEESFIMNKGTKVKIPVKKKGGAFVTVIGGRPSVTPWANPGALTVVQFTDDPGWSQERMWSWPMVKCSGENC